MKRLILLEQLEFSSGLGRYVRDKFVEKGVDVLVMNPRQVFWPKLWPALSCFSFNKQIWWERRWRAGLFSLAAWRRNSRICDRLLEKVLRPGDRILQMQTHYRPDRVYAQHEYYMYIMASLGLNLTVPGMPWVPAKAEQSEFLSRENNLLRRAKHVFAIADYVGEHMVQKVGIPAQNVSVAGCAGSDFYFQHPPANVPDKFTHTLLFVGWDFELKGGRDLIPAFLKARERIPQLRLMVAGPDPVVVGNHPGVEPLGAVRDKNRLLELYRQADIFVMPSVFDSFGFVFIEAMSQYLPCIGTDFQAMPEIIQHGKTGYIVPLRSPTALADAICTYYEREENRREMGLAAHERALARYQWDGVVEHMIQRMWG